MKTILIIFFLNVNFLSAQVTQEWITTYSGTGIGGYFADKAAVDKFGNFIVAGRGGFDNTDYILLKYSSFGNLLWERKFNGAVNNEDWFRDMVFDDSGNVYLTGSSYEGAANGHLNWATIKYSPDGVLRWEKSLDWTGHIGDVPFSICLDKNRNVLVAGYCFVGPVIYNDDIVIAKYSNDGVLLWTKSYNGSGTWGDWGYSVVTDDSCNAYVSGYSKFSKNDTFNVIVTIKYDTNGNQKWVREFLRASPEYAIPLFSKIDKGNNVIVCGNYNGNTDLITLKYKSDGNLLWSRYFNGVGNRSDFCNAMYTDDNMNIYICGRSEYPARSHDVLLIKYKPNGDTSLIRYFDNGNNLPDEAFGIVVDSLENIYLTGRTTIIGDDFLTLKYNSAGNLIWFRVYTLPLANSSYGIGLDKYSNVYIAGYRDSPSFPAIVCIKYSQLTEIQKTNTNEHSNEFNLYNYPNPFNSETSVYYSIPYNAQVKIIVYDNLGKELSILLDEYKLSGKYKLRMNASQFQSGVYYYSLHVDNKLIKNYKLVLIK